MPGSAVTAFGTAKPQLILLGRTFAAAASNWIEDSCVTMAAAIAFYASFSLAPTLVIVIAIAGFAFGADAVQGRLFKEIAGLTGPDGAQVIQTMVANAWKAGRSGWPAVISVVATVIGASATFSQLHDSLNLTWRARDQESPAAAVTESSPVWSGLRTLLRVRLVSFGLVLGVGFLMLVLLVVDTGLTVAIEWAWGDESVLHVAQQLTLLAMLSLVFAVLLRLLPDRRPRWRDVIAGALVAALLFTAGKRLFGLYLAGAGTANAFGAAGSLAVVLMWLFYSAAVFLFGAEFAAAWTRLREEPAAAAARPA